MADKQPDKPKAKRLVKNPETFRERALKASQDADQPKKAAKLKSAGGKVAKPTAGPLKKFLRILTPKYIRNSWQELRKVTWPSWKESRQLTFAVLIFAVIFGAIIALVDFGLDKLFRNILLK